MKKIIVILIVLLISCKKERTCECTTVTTKYKNAHPIGYSKEGKEYRTYTGRKNECSDYISSIPRDSTGFTWTDSISHTCHLQ